MADTLSVECPDCGCQLYFADAPPPPKREDCKRCGGTGTATVEMTSAEHCERHGYFLMPADVAAKMASLRAMRFGAASEPEPQADTPVEVRS